MMKKPLLIGILVVLVAVVGLYVWVRLAMGTVRTDLATQLSDALGQPVSIGSLGPAILPGPAVTLGDVKIGGDDQILVSRIDLSAGFAGLLSRRLEDVSVRVSGARVELPLPPMSMELAPAGGSTAGGGLEIVSVPPPVPLPSPRGRYGRSRNCSADSALWM